MAVVDVVDPPPEVSSKTCVPPQDPDEVFHVAPTQAVSLTLGPPELVAAYVSPDNARVPVLVTLKYCEVGSKVINAQLMTNGVPRVGEPLVVAPAAPQEALVTVSACVPLAFTVAEAGTAMATSAAVASATALVLRLRLVTTFPLAGKAGAALRRKSAAPPRFGED
jgi:hypothetical protein